MKFQGDARLARNEAEMCLSLKTTVASSGASTLSTIEYKAFRALATPSGGKIILSYVALTSCAVSGVPSWNLMPLRIFTVRVKPSLEDDQLSATSPTIFG